MTLTIGTGPFGPQSTGVFNFEVTAPGHVLFFEDVPSRVRAVFEGETVADSRGVKLLHETGLIPIYYFPEADLRADLLEPTDHTTHCPFKGDASYRSVRVGEQTARNAVWSYPRPLPSAPPLAGYAALYWHKMDAWFEEDEQIYVHARDPYHRVDTRPSSRRVEVSVNGEVVAATDKPVLLFETGLPVRYYIPPGDVRTDLLEPTDSTSECPYKGTASYWSVRAGGDVGQDLVWGYSEPLAEAAGVAGYFCFYNEKVDLTVDGEQLARPHTKFS